MRAPHPTYPLKLHLPEPGNYPHTVYAEYVPGSSPPAYRLDPIGMNLPIDVVIPDDLAALGYYWHGSLLTRADQPGGISTAAYPPPSWPSEREDCFTLARQSEHRRAGWRVREVAERVAKVTKTKPPKAPKDAPAPVPELAQQELF